MTTTDPLVQRASVEPLRPRARSPVALLIALDDDSDSQGETWRLRKSTTTIGRRATDILFPNDADISSLHATIERSSTADSRWSWRLIDQNSTNGTFVAMSEIYLQPGRTVMIGGTALECLSPSSDNEGLRLREIGAKQREFRIRGRKSITIGRIAKNADLVINDATINPCHAIVRRAETGWVLEDQGSRNGIWMRVAEYEIDSDTRFILGEQRFLIQLPVPPVLEQRP